MWWIFSAIKKGWKQIKKSFCSKALDCQRKLEPFFFMAISCPFIIRKKPTLYFLVLLRILHLSDISQISRFHNTKKNCYWNLLSIIFISFFFQVHLPIFSCFWLWSFQIFIFKCHKMCSYFMFLLNYILGKSDKVARQCRNGRTDYQWCSHYASKGEILWWYRQVWIMAWIIVGRWCF